MQTIAVVAVPGVVAFDLSTPCHVFGIVRPPAYDVRVCGRGQVQAGAFAIVPPYGLDALADADTVVVPGVEDHLRWTPDAADRAARPGRGSDGCAPDAELLDALRAAADRGARMVSICTGAFVLAAAGLLDGRRAATHWRHADELAVHFPRVTVEPDVLYVDDGAVLTSAGVAAGIDLCLYLVRQDCGAEVANRAARRIVVAPHRSGGQAQFIDRPVGDAAGTNLAATRAWMLEHLGEPLTVAGMAAHAGFSERTFARRFRAETGTTPLKWLLAERVDAARRMLETTEAPIELVATRCGFGTATGLREHFGRACATTPTAYRAAFRAA